MTAELGILPGRTGEKQVERLLQQLAARRLTEREVIGASLPLTHRGHNTLLDRHGRGSPITYEGGGILFMAEWEPDGGGQRVR